MRSFNCIRIQTLVAGTALLLAGFQAGAAAGYKLADKVGEQIAEFRDDVVDIKNSVDLTMASLDKIVTQAAVDPRKAYKEFEKSIPKLDSAAATARKHSEAMKPKGHAYFEQWEKEMTS